MIVTLLVIMLSVLFHLIVLLLSCVSCCRVHGQRRVIFVEKYGNGAEKKSVMFALEFTFYLTIPRVHLSKFL